MIFTILVDKRMSTVYVASMPRFGPIKENYIRVYIIARQLYSIRFQRTKNDYDLSITI